MIDDTTPTTYTELAVALGRVEEGIKGLKDSVDRIAKQGDENATTLSRHEVAIQVLQSKQTPRTPWYSIAAGVGSIAAIILAGIALLKVINP